MAVSIRNRRMKRKVRSEFELPLTSLLDVLVIVLVFLLKSFSSSPQVLPPPSGITLPMSATREVPTDSPYLVVTPEAIVFNNQRVLEFVPSADSLNKDSQPTYEFPKEALDEGGMRIPALYDALLGERNKSEVLRSKSRYRDKFGQPLPFEGILAIQADKSVSYQTLQKVFYTAAAAEFKMFRLVARKKE